MVFAQLLQTANIFNNQRCANCVSRFRRVTWSVYILLKSFSTCDIESKFPFIDLKVLGGHLSKIWTTLLRHFQPFCDEAIKWKAIALIYGMYGFINFSQTLIYKSWTKYIDSSLSSVENPPWAFLILSIWQIIGQDVLVLKKDFWMSPLPNIPKARTLLSFVILHLTLSSYFSPTSFPFTGVLYLNFEFYLNHFSL